MIITLTNVFRPASGNGRLPMEAKSRRSLHLCSGRMRRQRKKVSTPVFRITQIIHKIVKSLRLKCHRIVYLFDIAGPLHLEYGSTSMQVMQLMKISSFTVSTVHPGFQIKIYSITIARPNI